MQGDNISLRQRAVRKAKYMKQRILFKLTKRELRKAGIKNQNRFEFVKKKIKEKILKNETIQVAFIGYQDAASCDVFTSIYNVFRKDRRFRLTVIIAPYTHDSKENMLIRQKDSEDYLNKLGIPFLKGFDEENDSFFDMKDIYDIIFFEVEYSWMKEQFQARFFQNALPFLVPYGEFLADNVAGSHFSSPMMYDLYKIFPPGKDICGMMKTSSYIGEKNIYPFVGNPKLDLLIDKKYSPQDVWKVKDKRLRRIIWAPHHMWADYGNFLRYKDFMIEIAEKYREQLQIAFKPHPALAASLAEKCGWTYKEVESYYRVWREMHNTQVENLEWIDLFLTSDAMILDSIGFMAEYSLTQNPACVLYRENREGMREMKFSECGEVVYNHLYHAKCKDEIVHFIESVVLEGNDTMKEERNRFIAEQYYPPKTGNAGKNVYYQICKDIGIGVEEV